MLKGARRLAIAVVLALAASAAVAAPPPLAIGDAQPVAPPAIGVAPNGQRSPAIAWNGIHYFIVWVDYRAGDNRGEIYGARFSVAGHVIELGDLAISGPAIPGEPFDEPSVTWDGNEFVVSWRSFTKVYWRRVRDNRSFVDPAPVVIDSRAGAPHLASNGSSVLVATSWPAPPRIRTMRPEGTLIADLPFGVDPKTISLESISVATDGRRYLVSAFAGATLGWFIADDNAVIARGERVIGTSATATTAAWTGSEYLVVAGEPLTALRVNADGALLDSTVLSTGRIDGVSSAGGNGTALVSWNEAGGQGTRVVAPFAGGAFAAAQKSAGLPPIVLAGAGNSYMATWTAEGMLVHAVADSTGKIGDPNITARSPHEQRYASAAAANDGVGIVWQERDGTTPYISFAFRRPDGSEVLRTRLVPSAQNQYTPAIAWNGSEFAVAWFESDGPLTYASSVKALRLAADGTPLDPAPITIAGGATFYPESSSPPAIAWTGRTWLVAWASGTSLRKARMTREGVILDPGGVSIDVPLSPWGASCPSLTRAGAMTLVVFQDGSDPPGACNVASCPPPPPPGRVCAIRLNDDAVPIDAEPIVVASSADQYNIHPAAGWNGEEFLVVWDQFGPPASVHDSLGVRMSADGRLSDSFVVLPSQTQPGLAPDRISISSFGRDFLVAVPRKGPGVGAFAPGLYLVQVSDGAVAATYPVASGAWPSVVTASPSSGFVLNEELAGRDTFIGNVFRVVLRPINVAVSRRHAVGR